MSRAYETLGTLLGEIADLESTMALLGWDELVTMPARGATARGEAMATLAKITHERWTSPELAAEVDAAAPEVAGLEVADPSRANVRLARKEIERRSRIPADLAAAIARHSSAAYAIWVDAKTRSDFAAFAPALQEMVDLQKRVIDCFPAQAHPYDTLLDLNDLEYTTAELSTLFAGMKRGFAPIIGLIAERQDPARTAIWSGDFPIERQKALGLEFARAFGYQDDSWRFDETVHPFETAMSMHDVRITTRYRRDDLSYAFFATLHETGHGLYEDGVDPALARTPAGHGGTLDMHESQSRMWENLVGRSEAFWEWATPIFRRHFPDAYGSATPEDFYRAANAMQPSLIRVEADESTYNMHIMLRFELEQALFSGDLAVADLPGAWAEKMREYLGLTPPDDARGVLQDVHWSVGAMGTFVGYSLGNVIGAQLWSLIQRDLPGLDAGFAAGDFAPLRGWLRDNIHAHGRCLGTKATLARLGIEALDAEPLQASIAARAHELYG